MSDDLSEARAVLQTIGRDLAPDQFGDFSAALATARLRHDIRGAAAMARKTIREDLTSVASHALKLRAVLSAQKVRERQAPASAQSRIEGYLLPGGLGMDELLAALDLIGGAAKTELNDIQNLAPVELGSVPVMLVGGLAEIAEKHLQIEARFPKDPAGDWIGGPLVDFVNAVLATWNEPSMNAAAIRSAHNRWKRLRV